MSTPMTQKEYDERMDAIHRHHERRVELDPGHEEQYERMLSNEIDALDARFMARHP